MSVEKLKPLQNRVIIKRFPEEEKSEGGIVIPDTAKEKPIRGEVIAVGPGKMLDSGVRRPLDIKKGQTVLFGKYAGTEIKLNNKEDFVIMPEDEVMAYEEV